MVASSKKGSPQADSIPGSGGEDYLDKALSWDKRLELARERRAQVEAEAGPTQFVAKRKPWEGDATESDGVGIPAIPEYPDMPPARRAAMLARMKADAAGKGGRPQAHGGEDQDQAKARTDRNEVRDQAKVVRLADRAQGDAQATSDNPFLKDRQADEALEAVSRLLTSPTGSTSTASLARFDPIPPPLAELPRSWVWLVALVCLLAGVMAGILLAVALFLAIGAQVRVPETGSAMTVAADSTGASMSKPTQPALVPLRSSGGTEGATPAADAGTGSAPAAPAAPGVGQPVVRPVTLAATSTRRLPPVPALPGFSLDGVPATPSRTVQPSAPAVVDPIPVDPIIDAAPEMTAPQQPARMTGPGALAVAAVPETMPVLPQSDVPDVSASAPTVAEAPVPVEKIAFVSAEPSRPRAAYTRPALPVTPDPVFACDSCTLTDAVTLGKTVRLRLPSALARNERTHLRDLLRGAGFARVVPAIEPVPVRSSQVRYFRSEDADAARLLASMTRAELFDLSWFAPRPADGTIEVLIAVGGVSGAMPPG